MEEERRHTMIDDLILAKHEINLIIWLIQLLLDISMSKLLI